MLKQKATKAVTAALGFLLLTMMPTTLVTYSPWVNMAYSQEDPASAPFNASPNAKNTSAQNVREGERLPSQIGFAARVLATNFSEPLNIIYGPDNVLWITERAGKNITLVDPETDQS